MIRCKGFAALTICALTLSARAQIVAPPAISVVAVQVFCQGLQPYVSFVMPILPADRGQPGVVYVGMRDQAGSTAMFLQGSTWQGWDSGLFTPYSTATFGLNDQQITLPLNSNLAGGGWLLYAGYGALTPDAAVRVNAYVSVVHQTEAVTGKKVNSVDPDHYRRTLIQNDLVSNGKYSYVATGVENNARICQPDNEAY